MHLQSQRAPGQGIGARLKRAALSALQVPRVLGFRCRERPKNPCMHLRSSPRIAPATIVPSALRTRLTSCQVMTSVVRSRDGQVPLPALQPALAPAARRVCAQHGGPPAANLRPESAARNAASSGGAQHQMERPSYASRRRAWRHMRHGITHPPHAPAARCPTCSSGGPTRGVHLSPLRRRPCRMQLRAPAMPGIGAPAPGSGAPEGVSDVRTSMRLPTVAMSCD